MPSRLASPGTEGVSESKIINYFKGEGYTEEEVLREISEYEQEQAASDAMKDMPAQEFTLERAPQVQKKEPLPVKILLILLLVLLLTLLGIGIALLL